MSTFKVDNIQSSSNTAPTVFKNNAGTEIGQLTKAWLNYNGSTTSVRGSFNVSTVTKSGTGSYYVYYTTAFYDGNYSAVASAADYPGNDYGSGGCVNYFNTSNVNILCPRQATVACFDPVYVTLNISR